MGKTIGRNTNTNDTATISPAIGLNSTTSTKIADANSDRIFLSVSNPGNQGVFVKLQAATVDNVAKGVYVAARSVWHMPADNIYTGEVSAIALVDEPDVFVTEY